jgi:hypothetical protein
VIARIDAFPLIYAEPHYRGAMRCVTLARIEARDGTVGWGEAISQMPEATRATRTLIDDGFAPLLVGADPTNVELLWERMCRHAYWYGVEGIAAFAISAIDMAPWDLKGKLLGRPVANLLGSQLKDELPAMGSIIFDMDDLDWTLAEFESMRRAGDRIVKAGWGMTLESTFGQDRARDLRYLTEIRKVIGDELSLVVDVPGARALWDVPTAIRQAARVGAVRPALGRAAAAARRSRRSPPAAGRRGHADRHRRGRVEPGDLSARDRVRRGRRAAARPRPLPRPHRLPPGGQDDRGRRPQVQRPHLERCAEHRGEPALPGHLAAQRHAGLQAARVADAARPRRGPVGARATGCSRIGRSPGSE